MSSLYKLLISGVRSFSPKENETIQFGSPLTLICGQNGCGKTTIIESLKYATTGDLPPTSKGGAFINDPTIADRSIVNAEIKLGFISVDGKSMTVTRNMQLNRKKGRAANTFKSLEGQLAIILQGQKNLISTKNAELDTRVPLYLGASKAILEYVIFCHQDDSLWPLSEAGLLKKRFDEIFEAAKFTKVLDNLRGIRKDLAQDIRLIQGNVAHYAQDKARAGKIREKLHDLLAKVDTYTLEIADLVVKIEKLEKDADNLFRSNQSFQETLSEHERLKVLITSLDSSRQRLGGSLLVMEESDDQLGHMMANFEEVLNEKRAILAGKTERAAEFEKVLVALREKNNALAREEGVLLAKLEEYESNKLLLRKIAPDQGAEGYDDFGNLESLVHERESNLSTLVKKKKEELTAEKDDCQRIEIERTTKKENLVYCAREMGDKSGEITQLRQRILALRVPEDTVEIETTQLENLRARLQLKKQNLLGQTTLEIDEKKRIIRTLELDLEELMRKINSANKRSDLTSRVTLLRESRSDKVSVLEKMLSLYTSRFLELVGTDLESENADSVMDEKQREITLQVHETRRKLAEAKENLERSRSQLSHAEEQDAEKQKKKSAHFSKIVAVISEEEFPQYEKLVQELEEDYKTAVYNLNTYEVTKSYKMKAVEIAKSAKCCALCSRGFAEKELHTFLEATDANIQALTADKLTDDVNSLLEELQELQAINVDVLEYRRLALEKSPTNTALSAEFESNRARVQELEQEQIATEERLEKVAALAKPVGQICRTSEEIAEIDKQLEVLDAELEEQFGSLHTMEELQTMHQQKSFEVKNLRQAVSDYADEKLSVQKELSNLEGQIKDKELSISKAQLAFNEVKLMNSTIESLERQVHDLEGQKRQLDEELQHLDNVYQGKKKKLDELEAGFQKERAEREVALKSAVDSLKEYKRIHELVEFFEKHEEQKIEANKNLLSETSSKMKLVSLELADNSSQMAEINAALSDAANTERNIRDNLEYRQTGAEIDRLHQRISELDISGAEKAKNEYQQRSTQLRQQISDLNSQHYGKVGEVKQINDQIAALQKDLHEEFKDVDKTYHSEWLKLQSNLLVSNDILTYSQAMDNAIMQYHSMKMTEINRILRDLWSQTYKGTDIDGIEIKCDVSSVLTRGRSYNYRVVMFKKNSELDMRGRCSAGQKVLTSILIRLALAECFGTNCGMIALDEPTTNLDTENAELLANALNNIIDFRKLQKNFQLIVITHDERFLGHINGDSYTDNFYRIERDENQHSIIRSLPIHLMAE